ncbi:MAG: DUF2283 domain-containing protein [Candidatus Hydrogenedentes bacterium]|nr:DUF2283 domain-containing protein [Candidatus Hydrogenedentota bacterium]
MKVTYDSQVDVLRILFRDAPIQESDENNPGVILDYDKDGNLVGLEVLNASQRIENPRGVDYAVTA